MAPEFALSATVLGAPDAPALADFYHRLLGWGIVTSEPGWAMVRGPKGRPGLSFQDEEAYVPPVWPAGPDDPQMMMHLDFLVDDIATAGQHAIESGATLAGFQPQDTVRVYLDPAGHPFCLFTE